MAQQVKIVFTVTNNLAYDQRMQRICSTLQHHGFNVLLIGRLLPNTPSLNTTFKTKHLKCFINKTALFYIEYNIRLFIYLLFYKADIYSAVDLDTLLPNTLVAKLKGKKLFFDAHEYFTETPEVTDRKLVKWVWHIIGKCCVPYSNKAYTVGPELAKIFTTIHGKHFDVVRNVPIFIEPNSNLRNHVNIILYQGALNKSRGLEDAILAMKQIPNAILQIAGEGDLSEYLRALAKKHNLLDKVQFLGFVQPKDLKQLTATVTIGLNLLQNNGLSYYYSLANKFFDYILAGKPQICANFPEYINLNNKYNVALLSNCNATEIANHINNLLSNNELYNQLSNNCKLAAAHLNWQKEEEKLLAIYKNN